MKEHPDYKYRPRRKPKTLVKSPIPQNHHNHSHNHHTHHSNNKEQQPPPSTQHLSQKYPFSPVSSLELTLGIQPRTPTFPLAAHYQLAASPLDTTLALDLQARLQQMYAGSLYPPWRYFGCPPSALVHTDPQSPPSPVAYVCVKPPKRTTSPIVSSQTSTASPPSVI